MPDWREELGGLAGVFGWHAREAARAMRRALGAESYHVVAYRGYGTSDRALVLARVMQHEGIAPADAAHPRWRNLVDSIRRIECDPLPFARVRTRGERDPIARELVADDEGFVHEWLQLPTPLASSGWHEVELELAAAPARAAGAAPVRASARILVPAADAAFGVVSDMDDTVLQSEVTSFLRAARLLLLENARTRLPFPGVAEFYRALEAGTGSSPNPIFYVSSSPWNLYEVIAEFLEAHAIPAGPLLLRNWNLGPEIMRNAAHKTMLIREILATYPRLPFILVGDSGQEDPEIYSAIVREHPGRILAIYIRNVTPRPERPAAIRRLADEVREAGSTLLLVNDTLAAARHAAERGWIG